MAPVDSLPPENLLKIFRQSSLNKDSEKRRRQFAGLSFVCRAWRAPAQEVLWERVLLSSDRAADALIAAREGGLNPSIRELRLDGPTGVKASKVIEGCRGLRTAELIGPDVVDMQLLTLLSEAGTSSLSVDTTDRRFYRSRRLKSPYPSPLPDPQLFQPHITHLTIGPFSCSLGFPLVNVFLHVAPQLQSLFLINHPPVLRIDPSFFTPLKAASRLTHFGIDLTGAVDFISDIQGIASTAILNTVLGKVPASLGTLVIREWKHSSLQPLSTLATVLRDAPSISNLKVLEFVEKEIGRDFRRRKVRKGVVRVCSEKKVELRLVE